MSTQHPAEESRAMGREHADALVAVLLRAHGLDASCCDGAFLARSAERRRDVPARETPSAYLDRLAKDRAEAEALLASLRVAYSEFFRSPLAFALLEQWLLPGLLDARGRGGGGELRVWSAGCAAGQETWSLAVLLDGLTAGRDARGGAGVGYRIFATDLSEADLELARGGIYPPEALGNVRLRQLESCFSRMGDAYAVGARLRERVEFSFYDLLDPGTSCPPPCIYGEFDLVVCANVLIYYRPAAQRRILAKLRRSLAPGGYLMTGEAEHQVVEGAGGFRAVAPPAPVFRDVSGARGG
jgi:chemotaxis methyl-accepting protein methylase